VRATPNCSHSWRSAGIGLPGASSPLWIASNRRVRISADTVVRATGWTFDVVELRRGASHAV
jgi:hypothetical protein